MNEIDDTALSEQAAYYRARAPEYDEWWQRLGRYDRGHEATALWNREITEVEDALKTFHPNGDVLELASGTGWWTQRLAQTASTLTCVDASPEVITRNRDRLTAAGYRNVRYLEADLFAWQPEAKYDSVFFSFWLSHVPEDAFNNFWAMVRKALRPNGGVFLIDSRAAESSTARDHRMPEPNGVQERRLNDGRSFRVFKRYWEARELSRRLEQCSWTADLFDTPNYFVYGSVWPALSADRRIDL